MSEQICPPLDKCVSLGHLSPCLSAQSGFCVPVKSEQINTQSHSHKAPLPTLTLHGHMHIYSSALWVNGAREKDLEMAVRRCSTRQHTSLSSLESLQRVHTLNRGKHSEHKHNKGVGVLIWRGHALPPPPPDAVVIGDGRCISVHTQSIADLRG